jgi:ribosomal protein S18 acetylase RimI-like enzyme
MVPGVSLRQAAPDDVTALADLQFVEPSREAVVLAGGSTAGARRFQEELLRWSLAAGAIVLVAEVEGEPAGFALVSTGGGDIPPLRQVAGMAVRALGVPRALRAGARAVTRLRVDLRPPPGGTHLVELQVHPARRGAGIGGLLLDAVEARARAAESPHLSLTTGAENPARRLYERHGFRLAGERSDARYERLTGIPGRVLLVKDLASGRG